jgi:uncharacterized lipoprotein YddW (UPF0748 family)
MMNTKLNYARLALLCSLLVLGSSISKGQVRTEYRAFWVDTFNTNLNNHTDVVTVVNNAKATKANAIFVQVRRRGDSWYLNSLEPLGDRVPIQPGFDPLQDIINVAHAEGIEVHAFVIMNAIWGRAPNLFPPENPNHAFNLHGGYDAATNTIVPGPNNWLTRTLLPDTTPASTAISFQGHRFGSDFWIDFGHPDAAAYTVNVVKHLVQHYDIDGLHLDRIRYPDISISGQTPSTGTNIGYNPTNVERFQRHFNLAVGGPPPTPNNPQWNQWRRDQITNVVRRVYLEALAIKPQLKISAALIAFGGIGATESSWNSAEAFWRVYQDWRAWTEEGIIDIAIPMAYKAEHTATIRPQYDQWDAWLRNHLYNRAGITGQGSLVNAVEGTLRQTRRTLTPFSGPTNLSGIIFFSMATSDVAVASNPFAIPPGATPDRPFAEFASGLTTGKSVDGLVSYEPEGLTPIFNDPALIPTFSWKLAPTLGHVKGEARLADGSALDTAAITIENLATQSVRNAKTDGNGFFGAVDLQPGPYRAQVGSLYYCFNVTPGTVANADPDILAPQTSAAVTPATPDGQNGWYKTAPTITLSANDNCAGVSATEYSTDGGETWQTYSAPFAFSTEGTTTILYRSMDRAANSETAKSVTLKIDTSAPALTLSATPSVIWPLTGETVNVRIDGAGSDAVSGLATVSYVVTDEYGTPLTIPVRSLSGSSTTWSDTLGVVAQREGTDLDGRQYVVAATLTDVAGNTLTITTTILVPHDLRVGP